jgi:hypothetical protein
VDQKHAAVGILRRAILQRYFQAIADQIGPFNLPWSRTQRWSKRWYSKLPTDVRMNGAWRCSRVPCVTEKIGHTARFFCVVLYSLSKKRFIFSGIF